MDSLEYRFAFQDDPAGRRAANRNIIEVHGLDMTMWEERVGWDPDYVPFAFFDGDTVVALTCLYVMDMIVRGQWRRVAQVSSVATLPEYRMRGLNAELTRRSMAWAKEQGLTDTFLFSDDDATGFYEKQGFVGRSEWKTRVPVPGERNPGYRALNYDADEDLIQRLVHDRTPVSNVLGSRNPRLELFHLLYENAGEPRYIEELDLLVCCEVAGHLMTVYDMIGPELPEWSRVAYLVADPQTTMVELQFSPDRLTLSGAESVEYTANRLHVFPDEDLIEGQVMVPFTAHA
jgi:GNAT superfamily N-acetyltransferase